MTVRLVYQDYSAEDRSHEAEATTDAHGHVAFPARTLTASLGTRVAQILSSATEGAHASFGLHASVFAFGNGVEGFDYNELTHNAVDWTGSTGHMTSRMVVAASR
jgi:hypothetical protein